MHAQRQLSIHPAAFDPIAALEFTRQQLCREWVAPVFRKRSPAAATDINPPPI